MILITLYTHHPLFRSIVIGFFVSVFTETIQYFSRMGYAEFDDVFHNMIGLLIGILIMRITIKKIDRRNREEISTNEQEDKADDQK